MKKTFYFLALAAVLALTSGCRRGYSIMYAMGNQTTKEITIVAPYDKEPTTLAPGEYFTIGHYSFSYEEPGIDAFYFNNPVYIIMDGVKYQIDRNQQDNCLWEGNYHQASEELATTLRQEKGELVWVYDLTEDYIKRQIVVDE